MELLITTPPLTGCAYFHQKPQNQIPVGWLFSLIFWDVNSLQFCSWGGYFRKFRAPTARFPLEYTIESKNFDAPSARLIFYSFSTRKLVQNSQKFPPPSAAVGCLLSLTFWDSNFFHGVIRFGCFGHQFGRGALIKGGSLLTTPRYTPERSVCDDCFMHWQLKSNLNL